VGRTVEKLLDQTQKEESQRAAHHSIPAFRWKWVGLLKNTLRQKEESQRAAHHSIPALLGWVGLLKNTLRPNTKNHKQHITQSLLYRWEWVGLLKNTLESNTKKGITKSSTSLNPCF
jgi:hypothetical protein